MSEHTERLKQDLATLTERVRWLEQQMDQTAERQAQFGRPRYLIWGILLETLKGGGAADVQLWARDKLGQWTKKQVMEDVLAPPVLAIGSCLLKTTWVCVAWFPLDQEYYVIGAATCPTTECGDDSSS